MELTIQEYHAWKQIVSELRLLGVEINDQDELAKRLKNWGIAYANLSVFNKGLLKKSER